MWNTAASRGDKQICGTRLPAEVTNKRIRKHIRASCLAISRRLRVTFDLFLTSYCHQCVMGHFHS